MARRARSARRLALESLAAVVLLLLAAALANLVATRWPARLDLTADQRHTLSPISREVLARAESTIEVHAFLPTHAQPPYSSVVRAIRDQLEAYRAAADGRLRVRVYDPTDADLDATARAALEEKARGFGVPQVDLQVTQGDKRVRERVWFGVAVLYRDRQVTVPPVERAEDLEYHLTHALRDVLAPQRRRPVVAFSQGHGEPNVLQSPLARVLERDHELRNVRLDAELVPPDVDVLVVLGPRRPLRERARYALDQHLMRGRAVVALLDYQQQSDAFPDVLVPVASALEPQLARYGLEIDPTRTVVDRRHHVPAPVGRDAGGRVVTVHHPLFVATQQVADHPVTRGVPSLVVPMAAPIAVKGAGGQALVTTEPGSVLRRQVRSLSPEAVKAPDPALEEPGPAVVVAALEATLSSHFDAAPPPPESSPAPDPPAIREGQGAARLLVATSGTRLLAAHEGGLLFFQNAIDWAAADTDLVALRDRSRSDPPLRPTTAAERAWIKYGNVAIPPLLLALAGLLRRWRRRRRR